MACTRLVREGRPVENDADCRKFLDSVLPEAFKKLLTSNATSKWQTNVQEGIYNMLELFIDLVLVRLPSPSVPTTLLTTLALAFDVENEWNYKHRNQASMGRWQPAQAGIAGAADNHEFTRINGGAAYGWLCDLINHFGSGGGFDLLSQCLQRQGLTGKELACVLKVSANCASVLDKDTLQDAIQTSTEAAFDHLKRLGDEDLKTKEATSFSELTVVLKLLCHHFRPDSEETCDLMRLDIICRMLKTPLFNTRMNGLKEVSRLIDESNDRGYQSSRKGTLGPNYQKIKFILGNFNFV